MTLLSPCRPNNYSCIQALELDRGFPAFGWGCCRGNSHQLRGDEPRDRKKVKVKASARC
ncbi:hypothetical protein Bb109J_c3234 [Bdellovibrio bacteriovorus]|nr:hypothetical protein Bb109J_c3234 [Bdellovibrio bacteriovorus]